MPTATDDEKDLDQKDTDIAPQGEPRGADLDKDDFRQEEIQDFLKQSRGKSGKVKRVVKRKTKITTEEDVEETAKGSIEPQSGGVAIPVTGQQPAGGRHGFQQPTRPPQPPSQTVTPKEADPSEAAKDDEGLEEDKKPQNQDAKKADTSSVSPLPEGGQRGEGEEEPEKDKGKEKEEQGTEKEKKEDGVNKEKGEEDQASEEPVEKPQPEQGQQEQIPQSAESVQPQKQAPTQKPSEQPPKRKQRLGDKLKKASGAQDKIDNAKKWVDRGKKAVKAAQVTASFFAATWEIWVALAIVVAAVAFVILVTVAGLYGMCKTGGTIVPGLSQVCEAMDVESSFDIGQPVDGGTPDTVHEEVRSRLAGAGITVSSSGNCSDRNNRTCTSFAGMREATINEIIDFKRDCDAWAKTRGGTQCGVIVTGGTEVGHSASGTCTHGNGFKFDIRVTDLVEGYIRTNFRNTGQRRGGDNAEIWRNHLREDMIYYREANHWDVAVGCTSGSENEGDRG